ncbi:hypothetical protein LXL04_030329 [Taraxacum kok-saghyz]
MAALPLSNHHSLCAPRLVDASIFKSSQFRTQNLAFQSYPHLHSRHSSKPLLGLSRSLPNSYTGKSWRSFKSLCTAKDTTVKTSEDDALEESETDSDNETTLTVNSLLQLYKQSILNNDTTTISDIESTLNHIEEQKNKLSEQVTSLLSETTSGKEKYIRLQADFDNYRKRSEKERINVRSNAQGEVIGSLLPMVDNFERAKQQLKLETDQEKKIDASYQGIYKQFVEIMRSLRVAAVPTVGKPFDPSVHEAIAQEESMEFNEGVVVEEFRRGFVLGERLLRPAMVKVSAGPGPGRPKGPDGLSSEESNEQPQSQTQTVGL